MLETAQHCFKSARCEGDGDEEEWLIHYMLGKVAEQQQPHGGTCGTTGRPATSCTEAAATPRRSTTTTPLSWPWKALEGEAALAAG